MIGRLAKICLVAVLFVSISSCEKKSCKNVVCPAGQECYNGACLCQDGYEGTNCLTLSADKYVGSYNVSETCGTTQSNFPSYTVYILSDPNYPSHIRVTNLFNIGEAVFYVLNTDANNLGNTIYVPTQSISGTSTTISGSGRYDALNHRMIVDFDYTYNGGSYSCEHIFYKF